MSSDLPDAAAQLVLEINRRTANHSTSIGPGGFWRTMANLVMELDVQPSHLGSSLHGCRFGFLLLKKKHFRGFPYHISFKKTHTTFIHGKKYFGRGSNPT
jgi:hypothetical protein